MADYTNDFSLKFKEGTTLDFPTYSIAVPDGFEAKKNVDGRDFVIYKRFDPDGEDNMTDEDLLYTEIKLSHTPQQVGLVVEGDCTTQHTADVLTAVLFPHGGRGGSLRRFKTDLSVGFIEPWDNSFYITIVLNKSIFRMWLLVQDPAYFDDPTGEFPEFSEKNLKDIEKMIKKWVSTIQSKESAEDDEPVQVDTERMRELETTLGDTISNALRKDAEDAVHSLPAVIEMLQGIDATHMRGVRGLSNRIQAATRESKALHHIRIEIDTEKSWIGVYGRASSVRINRGETTYWVCDAAGDKTRYVVEKLIKETKKLTADRVYLDLLKNVDYNRQQGYEISVEGVRGAIFPRQEEPQIGTRKGSSKSEREESSAQGSAGKKANTPEPVGAKGKSPKTEAAVPPSKNNPRRFVQVVECANPQSWVEKKPDAMEQMRKELAALEEATAAATKKREYEKNKRFSALDGALKEKLELLDKNYEDAAAEIARQIDEVKQQIAKLNNERSSLKWFNFSEKNRLKKETESNELRIAELEKKQTDNEKRHIADVRKAKSANTREKQKVGREIDLQFPMPKETQEDIIKRAERRAKREQH